MTFLAWVAGIAFVLITPLVLAGDQSRYFAEFKKFAVFLAVILGIGLGPVLAVVMLNGG